MAPTQRVHLPRQGSKRVAEPSALVVSETFLASWVATHHHRSVASCADLETDLGANLGVDLGECSKIAPGSEVAQQTRSLQRFR